MTINHIDQLAEWWENAEVPKSIEAGDIVIVDRRHVGGGFDVWPARTATRAPSDNRRILARAPKPKPAWHDAVAVIAHTEEGHIRQVWERSGDTGYWLGTEGSLMRTNTLRDVTPLIEAEVTDEMIDRAHRSHVVYHLSESELRELLTDVLGIEAE